MQCGSGCPVKWGELQGGGRRENQAVISPVARQAEVTALTSKCRRFLLHVEEQGLVVISCFVFSPCYSQQQRGTSQGNSTVEFKRNNRIGFDLFNSEIKVTGKYCGSYLCGLRGYFFFWQHLSFHLMALSSPELCMLLILPVFKAVIKWTLLDFREMIMVPEMTERGSW